RGDGIGGDVDHLRSTGAVGDAELAGADAAPVIQVAEPGRLIDIAVLEVGAFDGGGRHGTGDAQRCGRISGHDEFAAAIGTDSHLQSAAGAVEAHGNVHTAGDSLVIHRLDDLVQ